MASSSLPILLLFSLLLLTSTFFHLSASFLLHLPITKHAPTNQHLTHIHFGTRPDPVSLLVDLSSRFLWLDCASVPGSLSRTPIPCLSIRCSTASSCAANLTTTTTSSSSPHPHPPPCVLLPTNPVSKSVGRGELFEDTVSVRFQPASTETLASFEVEDFLLTCAPNSLLGGLAGGVRGVFGLGKSSRISPVSQIAHKLDLPRKFFLCLPGGRSGSSSSGGMIFAGAGGNVPDGRVSEISRSMVYTPFLTPGEESKSKSTFGPSDDYSFRVNSVEVNGRKLSLPVTQIRARISSTEPFTTVGSGIYRALVRGFTVAAAESESLNLWMVEGGGGSNHGFGFEVCYRIGGVGGAVEEEVPVIDLVLQSEMVKWRIDGYNSMVRVGGEEERMVCLGVVDGGSDLEEDEMVIGAYQIEDNLLEFDLVTGMLGISSSSLLSKGTSCSELSLGAHAAHQSL